MWIPLWQSFCFGGRLKAVFGHFWPWPWPFLSLAVAVAVFGL
jgi:hypothetical protein